MPNRMCLGCRKSVPKDQLIRIVMEKDALSADWNGDAMGRGCYVHARSECLEKLKGKGLLTKALRSNRAFHAAEVVLLLDQLRRSLGLAERIS